MKNRTHLWMINQYALKTDQAGGTRHHTFAHYMRSDGIDTLLIASSLQLGRIGAQRIPRIKVESLDDAKFLWIRARPYNGNGVNRVLSMLDFSVRVILHCWFPQRLGVRPPDVIVGSSPHLFGALAGWILSRRHRVPFILEVRDLWPKSLESILGLNRRHPLVVVMAAMEKFLYMRSTLIIGLLEGVAAHVVSCAGPNAAPVVCIPNGVDLRHLPAATPVPDSNDFTVAYTGAHGVVNSLNTLLEASKLLRESGDRTPRGGSFKWKLFGDGVCKSDLLSYARLNDLRDVYFHEFVPKTEVFDIVSEADACILTGLSTSLYENGFSSNKLFDYFAAGRPVLCGLVAPNDPVSEACAGYLVAPEDPKALVEAVRKLANLPVSVRQTMGSRGRAYVEAKHDSQRLASQFSSAVLSVLR